MKNIIKKILKESEFDWTEKADVTWSTYYHEILSDVMGLPEDVNDVDIDTLMPIWYKVDVLTREVKDSTKLKNTSTFEEIYWNMKHLVKNVNEDKNQYLYSTMVGQVISDIEMMSRRLKHINESFDMDWAVEIKPEIDFKNLEDQPFIIQWKDGRVVDRGWRIGKVVKENGKEYILIKGNKNEPWTRWKLILAFQGKMKKYKFKFKDEEIQRNWTINESLDWVTEVGDSREKVLDELETRIKTMGWDVDLERDYERTTNGGYFFGKLWCGDEFYELYQYDDTFTVRFYTRQEYHGKTDYYQYDAYDDLTSKELISIMTRAIVQCLDGVGHIKESNDFEWTDSVPDPGEHDITNLEDLILGKKLRIGYKVRLIGHAKDVDLVFNNVGTVSDVYEKHIKYQGLDDDMDEYEYGAKILLNDVDGFNMYEYEINDTFGDQDDLTFEIISDNHLKESNDMDWAKDHVEFGSSLTEFDLTTGKPFIIEFDTDLTESSWNNILRHLNHQGWKWRMGNDDYYETLNYASYICGGEVEGHEYVPSAISGGERDGEEGIIGYWCSEEGWKDEHDDNYYGDRHYKLSQLEGLI
jgi:hypothetical protein